MGFKETGQRRLLNTVGGVAIMGMAAISCSKADTSLDIPQVNAVAQRTEAPQKTQRFRSLTVPYEIQYPESWSKGASIPNTPNLTESLDAFNGSQFDGINILLTISTKTINNWVEVEDYAKDSVAHLEPGSFQILKKENDKNIPEGLKQFEDIKIAGRPTIGVFYRINDNAAITVKRRDFLFFYFTTDSKSEKDSKRAWIASFTFPGAMELPENKDQATSVFKQFSEITQSFKLLQ